MIAPALSDSAPDLAPVHPPVAPLPIPEHLAGHRMAHCLEAVAPIIRRARRRVLDGAFDLAGRYRHAPFSPRAIEQELAMNLAEPLLVMMTRTMVLELNVARLEGRLEGATSEERFLSFLESLRTHAVTRQLLREYPVLVRQISVRVDQWASASLEFLERLCADWEVIRDRFFEEDPGSLMSVAGGAGDTHRNGRSVMIARFSTGARLVYKPRSLAVDEHFQQLLCWLNEHGAEPRFRLLRSLDRGAWGWAEFLDRKACEDEEEVRRFYQRQGAYAAILYALEASDFHCENLIAHGEHPMLIDLEALFHPRMNEAASSRADVIAGSTLGYSVLRTGLLPQRYWASDESAGVDMSGLGSVAGELTPHPVPQWESADTDEMHAVRRRMEMQGSSNRPWLNGVEANAFDYAADVAHGFASTYRILLRHRQELPAVLLTFARDEVRVILRPTQTYGALLYESFHPDMLRREDDRVALFQRLRAAGEGASQERVAEIERAELLRGDIPLFTSRPGSRHLWSSTGERIPDFFEEPGVALVQRRLGQLSDKDLERQLWILRASIASVGSHPEARALRSAEPRSASHPVLTGAKCLEAARAIGDRLQELALNGDGDAAWIGLIPLEERDWRLSALGPDLYDGLPGVILFLAHLSAMTCDSRYEALARSALKTLRAQVRDGLSPRAIGGFTGRGGLIYSLAHLGVLWSDATLFREAEDLARSIPDAVIEDRNFDLVSGSAGSILGLATLMCAQPSEAAMRAMRACGDHLLRTARQADCGFGWLSDGLGPEPLTGFAHGNAGIARALLEVCGWTGDRNYRNAAVAAMDYERARFNPEKRNWPDLRRRRKTDFVTAWCHGAPGIGLARLSGLSYIDDAATRQEIEAALETTMATGFGITHILCHGDLGNVDIFLYAADKLGALHWRERATGIAGRVLAEAAESGWVCGNPGGVESPGLMTGLAGIGYSLLRLADPASVPCVLALEPPAIR